MAFDIFVKQGRIIGFALLLNTRKINRPWIGSKQRIYINFNPRKLWLWFKFFLFGTIPIMETWAFHHKMCSKRNVWCYQNSFPTMDWFIQIIYLNNKIRLITETILYFLNLNWPILNSCRSSQPTKYAFWSKKNLVCFAILCHCNLHDNL